MQSIESTNLRSISLCSLNSYELLETLHWEYVLQRG
nr:MAG TPA: hypothetical protein [Caudoviricetes sp.]